MDAVVMNASSSLTGEAYIAATVTQCSHVYKRPVNGHWAASWSLGSIMVIGQQIMVKPVSDQSSSFRIFYIYYIEKFYNSDSAVTLFCLSFIRFMFPWLFIF